MLPSPAPGRRKPLPPGPPSQRDGGEVPGPGDARPGAGCGRAWRAAFTCPLIKRKRMLKPAPTPGAQPLWAGGGIIPWWLWRAVTWRRSAKATCPCFKRNPHRAPPASHPALWHRGAHSGPSSSSRPSFSLQGTTEERTATRLLPVLGIPCLLPGMNRPNAPLLRDVQSATGTDPATHVCQVISSGHGLEVAGHTLVGSVTHCPTAQTCCWLEN